MGPRVEGARRVLEMLRRQMLVADAHARIFVAEHRHHRPLRDPCHGQRRRDIVSEIVKVEILEPEPLHEVAEGPAERLGAARRANLTDV